MPPSRLQTLITTVAALEQRLCGGTPAVGAYLSDAELLRLLQTARPPAEMSAAGHTRLALSDVVQRQLVLDPGIRRGLSVTQATRLQLTENLFRFLSYACALHAEAYAAFEHFQFSVAAVFIQDPLAFESAHYPQRQLLELFVLALKGYDQQAGRRARSLLEQTTRSVNQVLTASANTTDACQTAKLEFAGFLQRYNRELQIFDKTVISKEQTQTLREDARLLVNRAIWEAVRGQILPKLLLRFLKDVWSKYLYVTYLRDGLDGETWREGLSAISILTRSLTLRDPQELFRFYQGGLARALAVVRTGAESIHQDPQLTEAFLSLMDGVHVAVMQGEEPQLPDLELVTAEADPPGMRHSEMDAATQTQWERLRVGTWYQIREAGLDCRGRLIHKDAALGYGLFSNYSGLRIARLEALDLGRALERGTIYPLDTTPVMERALEFAQEQLATYLPRLEARVIEVEIEWARQQAAAALRQKELAELAQQEAARQAQWLREEQAREQARALELQRQQAAAIEQQQLREQAQMEAEQLARLQRLQAQLRRDDAMTQAQQQARMQRVADSRLERESVARETARDHGQERALQIALGETARLQPGGRVEFSTADTTKTTCKLGLRLKSTHKMIFVDALGRKVVELFPPDLAALLVAGSAKILDYGVAFDDTLGSLIVDRSEKIYVE